MARPPRADEAGGQYHALNRGNARATIFHKEADDEAFERLLAEGLEEHKVQLFVYQLKGKRAQDSLLSQSKSPGPFSLPWAERTPRRAAKSNELLKRTIVERPNVFIDSGQNNYRVGWP